MSDADSVEVAYGQEATFGTFPSPPLSGPRTNYQKVRLRGESLKQENGTVRSAEIRADRQTTDIIRTAVRTSGAIDIEFSGLDSDDDGPYDDWIIAALLSTEDAKATAFRAGTATDRSSGGNISFTNPATITDRDAGGVWTNANVPNGSWIRISGSQQNNGIFKVVDTPTNDTITVWPAILITDTDDTGVQLDVLPDIINGTTLRSYGIQRAYTDLTNIFARLAGQCIDQWNLNVQNEQIVTGSFAFIGKTEVSSASDIDGSKVDAPESQVFNPVDHVDNVYENQAAFGITQWTMQLSNNLRTRLQVSTLGAISVGKGKCDVSGTINSYFSTVAHMDRFLAHTTTNLALVFTDDLGTGYIIDLPAVKLSAGARPATGQNTDVFNTMSYEAFRKSGATEPTGGVTIRVVKIPLLV